MLHCLKLLLSFVVVVAEEHGAPFTVAPTVSEHPMTQLFSEHSAGMSTSLKRVFHFNVTHTEDHS